MKRFVQRALAVACVALHTGVSVADELADAPDEASTEQIEHCVSDHDSARQLRLAQEWFQARTAMTACAVDRCPLAISADCRVWLDELNRSLPTLLVLLERADGLPVQPSRVELDGQPVQLSDPPTPLELVPGSHRLRITFAGEPVIERKFELVQAEKNHVERIRLQARPVRVHGAQNRPVPRAERPVPAATYLLSAGALAAFAGSTAWLVSALNERRDARAYCAPTCDHSVRKSIERRLLLADVSGGVGLTLGAIALYTFLRRPTLHIDAQATGPAVLATGNGLELGWQGRF
jgi:hypothetical protein